MLKVNVISLPYIFQVLYVLCFTRPRYQVSVYRTIGPLVCYCRPPLTLYRDFLQEDVFSEKIPSKCKKTKHKVRLYLA